MRTLEFGPGDHRYERLYASLVTGNPERERKRNKLLGEVTDKLETIGVIKPAVDVNTGKPREHTPDEIRFYVAPEGGVLVLEEDTYEIAVARAKGAIETGVHPGLAREFEDTLAWLESLPKQDAVPAEPSA